MFWIASTHVCGVERRLARNDSSRASPTYSRSSAACRLVFHAFCLARAALISSTARLRQPRIRPCREHAAENACPQARRRTRRPASGRAIRATPGRRPPCWYSLPSSPTIVIPVLPRHPSASGGGRLFLAFRAACGVGVRPRLVASGHALPIPPAYGPVAQPCVLCVLCGSTSCPNTFEGMQRGTGFQACPSSLFCSSIPIETACRFTTPSSSAGRQLRPDAP
jgi:hypothetical protein